MKRSSFRWLPLSLLVITAPAAADIVEPGFAETCTLEGVQAEHAGQTCIACGTYYAEASRCDDELREGGFTQVCRSRGASSWTQIGCRDGAAPPATTEPAPPATTEPAPPATTEPAPPATTEPAPPATTEPAPTPPPTPPATTPPAPASESSGWGCAVSTRETSGTAAWLALAGAFVLAWRPAHTKRAP